MGAATYWPLADLPMSGLWGRALPDGACAAASAGGVPALLAESFETVEEDVEAELELELVVAALTDGGAFVM